MAAESVAGQAGDRGRGVLQWGRSRMAAESDGDGARAVRAHGASMGPQPNGCGKLHRAGTEAGAEPGFNGAAAEWLRKERTATPREREPACFNGAAAEWLRKVEPGAASRRDAPRFNGAAAEWLRKGRAPGRPAPRRFASMGPQPNGCGKFNRPSNIKPAITRLQWGRSRMAAERRLLACRRGERHRASMGPQPNGCGKASHRPGSRRAAGCASMGPQPNGCGKPRAARWGHSTVQLQWGRSRMAAERRALRALLKNCECFNGAAAEWLRKGARPASPSRSQTRFNGAAAEWLRKEQRAR